MFSYPIRLPIPKKDMFRAEKSVLRPDRKFHRGSLIPITAAPQSVSGASKTPLAAGVSYLGGGSTDVLSFIPPPGSEVHPPLCACR